MSVSALETAVQRLLLGLDMPAVAVSIADPDALVDPLPVEHLEAMRADDICPLRISDRRDMLNACYTKIAGRLENVLGVSLVHPSSGIRLLVLLCVEAYIGGRAGLSFYLEISSWTQKAHEELTGEGLSEHNLRAIEGGLRIGDIRAVLDTASTQLLGVPGMDLLRRLDIPPPAVYPEPKPELVTIFQDPSRPLQYWLDRDRNGLFLFVIYYSGKCSYLQCFGCALPSLSSDRAINPYHLMAQTDYTLDRMISEAELRELRTVFLSNNGSLFDEPTFSRAALLHAITKIIGKAPKVRRIVFETRAEFLTDDKLEALNTMQSEMKSEVRFEIALGVEVFDQTIRNRVARKGLRNAGIERLIALLGRHDIDLRCYFMLKPHPSMTDDAAFADIEAGLDYLDALAERHGTNIVMHLNPTYVAIGTALEDEFRAGNYEPPKLADVLEFRRRQGHRRTRLHLGLNDEGLAVEGGSFIRPGDEETLLQLRKHNMIVD